MPERAPAVPDSTSGRRAAPEVPDEPPPEFGLPDLSALPITGFTRRRMAFLGAGLLAAWIVISFARQVGDASAATARLEGLEASNRQLTGRVAGLQREYELIQGQAWIEQQARGYGLGSEREVPFTLAPGSPALGSAAPGSAALRLGADTTPSTPLESWLTLLFGPGR